MRIEDTRARLPRRRLPHQLSRVRSYGLPLEAGDSMSTYLARFPGPDAASVPLDGDTLTAAHADLTRRVACLLYTSDAVDE